MNRYRNNQNNIMYAFIGIVILIGAGMHMNVQEMTFNPVIRPRLREQGTPDSEPLKKSTRVKTSEILCPLDCSSIIGSSCVNGKCTDPYLYLQRF